MLPLRYFDIMPFAYYLLGVPQIIWPCKDCPFFLSSPLIPFSRWALHIGHCLSDSTHALLKNWWAKIYPRGAGVELLAPLPPQIWPSAPPLGARPQSRKIETRRSRKRILFLFLVSWRFLVKLGRESHLRKSSEEERNVHWPRRTLFLLASINPSQKYSRFSISTWIKNKPNNSQNKRFFLPSSR